MSGRGLIPSKQLHAELDNQYQQCPQHNAENTDKKQSEIQHVYLHEAKRLRPDLAEYPPVDFAELEEWIQDHLQENPHTT